jgi:hypothetical protein
MKDLIIKLLLDYSETMVKTSSLTNEIERIEIITSDNFTLVADKIIELYNR